MPDGLKPEDFDVLILWPPGSPEAREEVLMVKTVVDLCQKHGYGRVTQILMGVKDLMRRPERLEEYRKHKERFLSLLEVIEIK